ncbi:MAG TPA: hypothetical protein VG838_00490 [Opitutaceae bacterium]|nr:hypothetical protein [Opitutaceae bacterium]
MGDLATLPTWADDTDYTSADFNALFAALTIANNAVTSGKIAASAVILSKIEDIADAVLLGNVSGDDAAPAELGRDDIWTILNGGDGIINVLQANYLKQPLATGYPTSGAINLAMNQSNRAKIMLVGNATFTPVGMAEGVTLYVWLKNVSGGSITLGWDSGITLPAGVTLPTSLANGASVLVRLCGYGTTIPEVVGSIN